MKPSMIIALLVCIFSFIMAVSSAIPLNNHTVGGALFGLAIAILLASWEKPLA